MSAQKAREATSEETHRECCEHAHASKSHTEKDVSSFTVYPEEGIDEHELTNAIKELKIPQVCWASKFQKEEVAFGVWVLKVGAIVENDAVDADTLMEQMKTCHSNGKPLIKSIQFNVTNTIDA